LAAGNSVFAALSHPLLAILNKLSAPYRNRKGIQVMIDGVPFISYEHPLMIPGSVQFQNGPLRPDSEVAKKAFAGYRRPPRLKPN
jgi:hypothetical protein